MKILQITNKVPYPEKDGGAIACMNLLRGLSKNGHELTLLAMTTLKHNVSIEDIPNNIKELTEIRLVDVPAPITIPGAIKNLLFSNLPYNAQRFISEEFSNSLMSLFKEKEFDLIQLEGLYICPYIPLIRRYSKAKIAYRAHNVEYEIWDRTAKLAGGIKKWYFRILSKRIKKFEKSWMDSYDLLVPITHRDGQILNQLGNTKPIHVSQTGIDTTHLIKDNSDLEYPSLFHIGSLEWTPNQEGLIWFLDYCWENICEKYPDLKFYVAGRNAPEWLKEKLDKENIVFLGEIDDAYSFMNSKSIMLVPLHSGSGMRIKIIEGMALGKAIVSTTIGTEGIKTTNNENILIADTIDEFNRAIIQLIENKNLFTRISDNASLFIHENFNNLALAKELSEFYIKNLEHQ